MGLLLGVSLVARLHYNNLDKKKEAPQTYALKQMLVNVGDYGDNFCFYKEVKP